MDPSAASSQKFAEQRSKRLSSRVARPVPWDVPGMFLEHPKYIGMLLEHATNFPGMLECDAFLAAVMGLMLAQPLPSEEATT